MLRRSSTLPLLALACGLLACPVTGPGGGGGGGGGGPVVIYPEVPVGSLVITEILAHPNVGRPEFLELVNVSDEAIDLLGCRLSDGGTTEHLWSGIVLVKDRASPSVEQCTHLVMHLHHIAVRGLGKQSMAGW